MNKLKSHTNPITPMVNGEYPLTYCSSCNKPVRFNRGMGRYTTADGAGSPNCNGGSN